jgi:hypothetical protein
MPRRIGPAIGWLGPPELATLLLGTAEGVGALLEPSVGVEGAWVVASTVLGTMWWLWSLLADSTIFTGRN